MPQWQKVDNLEGSAQGLEEEAVPRSESVDIEEFNSKLESILCKCRKESASPFASVYSSLALFLSSLNSHISLSQSSLHSMISLRVLKNVVYPSALVVVLDVKCVPQAPVFKLMVPSG